VQNRTVYCLVGFVTAYRYWAYDKFEKQIDKCRLRLSQCVVLPPFQRKGHASRLLRAVYHLARGNEHILDVTVEDPSPDFQAMRDVADACMLEAELNGGLAELLQGMAALVNIGRRFKLCMRQLRRLADVAEFHKVLVRHQFLSIDSAQDGTDLRLGPSILHPCALKRTSLHSIFLLLTI